MYYDGSLNPCSVCLSTLCAIITLYASFLCPPSMCPKNNILVYYFYVCKAWIPCLTMIFMTLDYGWLNVLIVYFCKFLYICNEHFIMPFSVFFTITAFLLIIFVQTVCLWSNISCIEDNFVLWKLSINCLIFW